MKKYFKIIFIISFLYLLSTSYVFAQNIGEQKQFFVESSFDVLNRNKVDSVLVKTSPKLYFYIEKSWWDSQYQLKRDEILRNLEDLSVEFQNNIYPKITSVFGFERIPGIDMDERITVLFHPVKGNEVGYFRTNDGYEKIQMPNSNEREMVYMSTNVLTSLSIKNVLAHELVHLITFNQKNRAFNVEEDTWLNEARADYSSTILGYDDNYNGSNLQQRVKDFVESSSNSITEWTGVAYDYASVTLFTHYLVDQYGLNILVDSLKSKYIGIESINYALARIGSSNFSDVFTNWTLASVLNDCSLGNKYCYRNKNLVNLKISPNINFLPFSGNVSLSVINVTKNWSASWQKFIGGNGDLKLEFSSLSGLNFVVPYILEDKNSRYSVEFLSFNNNKKGVINVSNFGKDFKSLIIIPSLQEIASGLNGLDISSSYNYSVAIGGDIPDSNQLLMNQLLAQIELLKKQIAEILAQRGITQYTCSQLNSDLYFGLSNNSDVKCLQQVLKNQGVLVYPEGLITGNFWTLTQQAVIKFQAKYNILQTGYVGPITRTKINQILNGG